MRGVFKITAPVDKRFHLDLGLDHWLLFTEWRPDIALNPQYAHLAYLIRHTPRVGAKVFHRKPDGSFCEGHIMFDLELVRIAFAREQVWKVERWEPLTLSPSLKCACGDHGHIRNGRWVPA